MSDCIHCDIHELLESRLQNQEVNLAEIAAKVTEVLADLILMAPPDEQSTLMADIVGSENSIHWARATAGATGVKPDGFS